MVKRRGNNRWVLVLLSIVAIGAALYWLFKPTPVRVDTTPVSRGPLTVTVDAEGKTRVRDRYDITAPTDGHLSRIDLQEGDIVRQGQVVAHIDPVPLQSSIDEARGRIAEWEAQKEGVATMRPKPEEIGRANTRIQAARSALRESQAKSEQIKARLEQARREVERSRMLVANGAIPRRDLELAELEVTKLERELEAGHMTQQIANSEIAVAKAELAVLQKKVSDPEYLTRVYDAKIAATKAEISRLTNERGRTDVHSPISGEVLRVFQKSEKYVTDGTPLLQLGSTGRLELVIDVLSTEAVYVKPGQEIVLDETTDSGKHIVGRVRLVEPSAFTETSPLGVEEQRVNVIGDIVGPHGRLGDGYRVEARIITWKNNSVERVPVSALFRHGKQWAVYTVENGRAKLRDVQIGERNQVEAQLLSGLSPGESVVVHPSDQVADGKRVIATTTNFD